MTTTYLDQMGDKRREIVDEAREHLMRGLAMLNCSREQMGRIWPVIVLEFPLLGPPIPTSTKSWAESLTKDKEPTPQSTEEVQILSIEVTDIRAVNGGGTLKALAAVSMDTNLGTIEIKDFKVIHQEGKKPWVSAPQAKWEDNDGETKYKNLIELPPELKKEVSKKILEACYDQFGGQDA